MSIPIKTRPSTETSFVNQKAFTIKASGHAFDIISRGIYTDAYLAIVRELGCNAYDSQIEAGYTEPFKVHCPTHDNLKLVIRDYGTGMTADKINNVYTTVFESDKTESNNQIGCLGLGSKSPFALYNEFTVISYVDGKADRYLCFKNEENLPQISHLATEDTSEHNGVEIIIPVKSGDVSHFARVAQQAFSVFAKPPICNIHITPVSYSIKTSNYGIVTGYQNTANAIMGNVRYRINIDAIENLTNNQRSVLRSGIDLFFKIGDLSFAASREELNLDNVTKMRIKNKIDIIIAEYEKDLQKEVDKANTMAEAFNIFNVKKIIPVDKTKIKWNNKEIVSTIDLPSEIKIDNYCYRKTSTRQLYLQNWLKPNIVINDIPRGVYVKVEQNHLSPCFVIKPEDLEPTLSLIDCSLDYAQKTFNIYKASELKHTPKKYQQGRVPKVGKYNGGYTLSRSFSQVDVPKDGYYIVVNRNRFKFGDKFNITFNDFINIRNFMIYINKNVDVYCIKEKSFKKSAGNLKCFFTYTKECCTEYIKNQKIITYEKYKFDSQILKYSKYLPPDIVDIHKNYKNISMPSNLNKVKELLGVLENVQIDNLTEKVEKALKKYELLFQPSYGHVVKYIDLVNKGMFN